MAYCLSSFKEEYGKEGGERKGEKGGKGEKREARSFRFSGPFTVYQYKPIDSIK